MLIPATGLSWFQPLRLTPFWPGYIIWTMLSFAAFWFASARLFGPRVAWFAAISPAIALGLIPGQTSLLASAGLLTAFVIRSSVGRGALLGLALTLKPQLVLMAPLFLLMKRDLLALAVMALVVAATAGLATAAFGPAIWAEWIRSMPNFQQVLEDRHLALSAVSPASYATVIGVPAPLALACGIAVGIVIASRANSLGADKMAAAVAAASLLAAPYALRYDLAALMPLVVSTILYQDNRRGFVATLAYSAVLGPLSIISAVPSLFQKGRHALGTHDSNDDQRSGGDGDAVGDPGVLVENSNSIGSRVAGEHPRGQDQ
jgi:hypothetical protein